MTRVDLGRDTSGRPLVVDDTWLVKLRHAESVLGHRFAIIQGSYRAGHGAALSGGTHDEAGAGDLRTWDIPAFIGLARCVLELRRAGLVCWARHKSQGFPDAEIHALDYGNPGLSPSAAAQVRSWERGRNGLSGRSEGPDDGPRVTIPKAVPPMPTTDNGWPASPDRNVVRLVPLIINGASFAPGVRAGDVHTVLGYVAQQVNDHVEKAHPGWCWGYAYRKNRNASRLSRHSGAIAIDFNAPLHPNGVKTTKTFSAFEIATIHSILAPLDGAVRWGGDYTGTPDSMHLEVNCSPAELAPIATKIRNGTITYGDDVMSPADWAKFKQIADEAATAAAERVLTGAVVNRNVDGKETLTSLGAILTNIETDGDRTLTALKEIATKVGATFPKARA